MKNRYPPTRAVYVDVDGTLVINGVLNSTLVDWCKQRRVDGWRVYLWSARGMEYALSVSQIHGVESLFDAILPKPGAVVDDLGIGWGKYIKVLLP